MNKIQISNQCSNESRNISFHKAILDEIVESKLTSIVTLFFNIFGIALLAYAPGFIELFPLYSVGVAILNIVFGWNACERAVNKQFQQKAHKG